ncbi:zinc finger protein 626-like isoform X2 [Colias croceus]|nr:zinc finger protein 626-like isoform X2 [Colias croceus]
MIRSICIICLEHTRIANSIFDYNGDLTYAEMILFVANIQIIESKLDEPLICLKCRNKLKELYDFKVLIRRYLISRSHSELNALQQRRLVFDNIDEFKLLLNPIKDQAKQNIKPADFKCLLLDNKNFFTHYETVITKICNEKTIPVTDISESIIEKYDDDDDDLDNGTLDGYNMDDMYLEDQEEHANKKIGNDNTDKKSECTKVCIKPVFLRDITSKSVRTKRPPKPNRARKIICSQCGKLTKNIHSHMFIHTGVKEFKCEYEKCNKAFFTRGPLKAHMKIHFSDPDVEYKCDHCTAVFAQQTALISHMTSHAANRPHVCDICQRDFKRLSALNRHKLIHTIPMCKCEVCGWGCRTKSALRHHERVHTGERPFNCKICSQPYSYKRDFTRHCLNKHGIFLKHRKIDVMDEETMQNERAIMKDLLFKVESGLTINEISNPYKGPQAAMAFEMAIKFLIENKM